MMPLAVSADLVLFAGPQASGKSTVARALVAALRGQGERVALVELDAIAEMALPTLPSWDDAVRILALVAGEWAQRELTCVVAEGVSSQDEINVLTAHAPASAAVVTVAMTTPLDVASPRARADPTRGVSRDHSWLSDRYDEWEVELSRVAADVRLDMGALCVEQGVRLVGMALKSARAGQAENP